MSMFTFGFTEDMKASATELDDRMNQKFAGIVTEVSSMMARKGDDYNRVHTFAENMIFGDASWGTLVVIKAHRAASLVAKGGNAVYDSLDDVILDLIVYGMNWLAWRRAKRELDVRL